MKKSKRLLALVLSVTMVVSGLLASNHANIKAEASDETKEDLKILILGNSYGRDAYEYMYEVFQQSGKYNRIVIGDLFMSGQSLQGHVSSLLSAYGVDEGDSPIITEDELKQNTVGSKLDYHYYKMEGTEKYPYVYPTETTTTETTINFKDKLVEEDWDIVTIQQGPSFMNNGTNNNQFGLDATLLKALGDETTMSGITGKTYTEANSYVDVLYDYIKKNKPDAKIYYHQTFANLSSDYYLKYDTISGTNADKNRTQAMFVGLSDWTVNHINDYIGDGKTVNEVNRKLDGIIPAGASFMYLYESMPTETLQKRLYRDDIHLASEGRYLAGLTWYQAITGNPVTDVTDNYVPNFACYEILDTLKAAANFGNSCIGTDGKYTSPSYQIKDQMVVFDGVTVNEDMYTSSHRTEALQGYGLAGYEDFDALYNAENWNMHTSTRTQNDFTTAASVGSDETITTVDVVSAYNAVGNSPSGKVATVTATKTETEQTMTQQDIYYTKYDSKKEISRLSFMTQIPAWDAGDAVVYLSYADDQNWKAYFPQYDQVRTCVDGSVTTSGVTTVSKAEVSCSANRDDAYTTTTVQGAYNYISVDMQYKVEGEKGYYYVTITGWDNRDLNNPVNIARNFIKFEVCSNPTTENTGMIDTLRLGYIGDYSSGTRTTYFDNIEYSYYDAADAADLDEKIGALSSEVSSENAETIHTLYNRYQAYVKAGTDGLLTNGEKIREQELILSNPEVLEIADDIEALGVITLDKEETVTALSARYATLDDSVKECVYNYTKLERAVATINYLKTNDVYFYDDFDTAQNSYCWTLANQNVEQDYGTAIANADVDESYKTKLDTPLVDAPGSDGYSGNGLALPRILTYPFYASQNTTVPYSRIYTIGDVDFKGGVLEATFQYKTPTWQSANSPVIIVSYTDQYNWEGFRFARGTGIDSIQCSDSSGSVQIDTKRIASDITFTPESTAGFCEWRGSVWKSIKMAYVMGEDGNAVYQFTVVGYELDTGNQLTATYTYPVEKPLDNLYFTSVSTLDSGATANQTALIDNVSVKVLKNIEDYPNALEVQNDINALGMITSASKSTVETLVEKYEALSDEEKLLIVHYSKLKQAKETLDKLDAESIDFYDDFDGAQNDNYWTSTNVDVESYYARIYEVDGLDTHNGIVKAEYDYTSYDWQASTYAIIIMDYQDQYNWEGFTVGRGTELYSVQLSKNGDNVTVSTQNKMSELVCNPTDQNGLAEGWRHLSMEYTTDAKGNPIYAFTITTTGSRNDSNTPMTVTFTYPVSKPIDNIRFATTGSLSNTALVDNVELTFIHDQAEYDKIHPTAQVLGATIKKASTFDKQDLRFVATVKENQQLISQGYHVAGYGYMLTLEQEVIREGLSSLEIDTLEKSDGKWTGTIKGLTKATAVGYKETTTLPEEEFTVTLTNSVVVAEGDSKRAGVKFHLGIFVRYENENGAVTYSYSGNPTEKTHVRSVYAVAKSIAQEMVADYPNDVTYADLWEDNTTSAQDAISKILTDTTQKSQTTQSVGEKEYKNYEILLRFTSKNAGLIT